MDFLFKVQQKELDFRLETNREPKSLYLGHKEYREFKDFMEYLLGPSYFFDPENSIIGITFYGLKVYRVYTESHLAVSI